PSRTIASRGGEEERRKRVEQVSLVHLRRRHVEGEAEEEREPVQRRFSFPAGARLGRGVTGSRPRVPPRRQQRGESESGQREQPAFLVGESVAPPVAVPNLFRLASEQEPPEVVRAQGQPRLRI